MKTYKVTVNYLKDKVAAQECYLINDVGHPINAEIEALMQFWSTHSFADHQIDGCAQIEEVI